MTKLKPAEEAKIEGWDSLKDVAFAVKKPTQTLGNWHKNSPELFHAVLRGAIKPKK